MWIVWTLLVGLVAGLLARLVMPGKDAVGVLITVGLGIGGALVTTVVGRVLGWYESGEAAGVFGAVVGAVALLAIYRVVARPSGPPPAP